MNKSNLSQILANIEKLVADTNSVSPIEAERQVLQILTPLLEADGYVVEFTGGVGDGGIDYLATKTANSRDSALKVGIQYKHFRRHAGLDTVRSAIGTTVLNDVDRLILLCNSGFTASARQAVERDLPTTVELFDMDSLRAWVSRIEKTLDSNQSTVIKAITEFSKMLARLVATNPKGLQDIEWRDSERMLAEVFEALGFKATLTPSSKDGGKDIILECIVSGFKKTYIVEVKHWRSGQRVGHKFISEFINVIAREKREGGLYLATYGYNDNAFESLTEVQKERVHFGEQEKIVSLCQTFVKAESGIWSAPQTLPDLLFD